MNLQEISEKLNVSKATISRVINNKPGVNPQKRDEIKQFLRENEIVKNSENNSIVIVIPDFENPFFGEIIKEISKVVLKEGYQVIIYDADENIENEKNIVKSIIKNGAAGVIFCVSNGDTSTKNVILLQNSKIPVVLFDRELDFPIGGVFLNDFQSGYLATEKLISKGCKNIALIHGSLDLKHIKNRFDGYKYSLSQHNIAINKNILFQGDMKIESGNEIMKNIVEKNIEVDGVLILNNFMTIGVMNYINNTDISLYDKYKVVGYDIPEYVFNLNSKINLVTRSRKEMGKLTGEMMLEKISGKCTHTKKIIIDPIIL